MQAPKPTPKYELTIKSFNGIDTRNSPSKVAFNRSPNAVNMIRETAGNNRKRRGYETLLELKDSSGRKEQINGFHKFVSDNEKKTLIHAGQSIYVLDEKGNKFRADRVYSNANNHMSMSRQIKGKLFIFDGKELIYFDGKDVKKASEGAYVPTIYIAKRPNGGGVPLEPINLITPTRKEKFTGDSTNKTFQLSATNIDSKEVKIEALKSDAKYDTLKEGKDFTVNRTLGTFTLTSASPTPVVGEDNLTVTYDKTVEGYADKINKCTICTRYGINGARDRLFCSGNSKFPNYDWYSKADDPTMWGDTWYSKIGQEDSEIVGYSIINDNLVTHKGGNENDLNANIRKGEFDEKIGAVFRSVGSYQAIGALSKYAFVTLNNEPLYLSVVNSVHAITPSDISGERASQERSYFISEELQKHDLKNAYAVEYNGFYMLTAGDKMYLLDGTQLVLEKGLPYSTRQYECYVFTHIGARVLYKKGDELWFGTDDGKVKRFFNDFKASSFIDDGKVEIEELEVDGEIVRTKKSIPCFFETSEFYTSKESLKKTFRHIAVCLNAFPHTGCRVWVRVNGTWQLAFDYNAGANYFVWDEVDFSDFSFRLDETPTLLGGKYKAKKQLHIQLKFENNKPQPFSLLWAKLKYTLGNEFIK